MYFKLEMIVALATALSFEICSAAHAYQKTALREHNKYRATHQAPALQMDETLNGLAVKCAKYYANKGIIDHTCPYVGDNGENLVGGPGKWSPDQFATTGTKSWYDEVSVYDYNDPGYKDSTGHFTQLVWVSSKRFGFGVVTSKGFTAGVGLYSPAGNYDGEFLDNVLPPL